MHSRRVRLGPVNPAASSALGESIMAGKDVRRHAARDQFTRNRRQHDVASRASRERDRSRVETEASDNLAQLASDSVALDKKTSGAVRRRLSRVTRTLLSARAIFRRSAPVSEASAMTSAPSNRSHRADRSSIRSTASRGVLSIAMDCSIPPFDETAVGKNIKRRFKFRGTCDGGTSGLVSIRRLDPGRSACQSRRQRARGRGLSSASALWRLDVQQRGRCDPRGDVASRICDLALQLSRRRRQRG